MSTIDWPTSITPAAVQWQVQKAGVQFASPFNGTTQAVDYVAERWAVSLSLPNQRNPGALAALMNSLAGGVNRVNLWHHGSGGQPAGSLRGVPTLGNGAARGDATLTLAGCTGGSLLLSGSFELDSNSDGVADGWLIIQGGSVGTVSQSLAAGPAIAGEYGVWYQVVQSSALNGSVGVYQDVAVSAGQGYILAADALATAGATLSLAVQWYSAANLFISEMAAIGLSPSLGRYSVSGLAPAGAARGRVIITANSTSGATKILAVDNAALIQLPSDGKFVGPATLLAGDMIGCSGHLFQVASDCAANDAGVMTVPIVNRVRSTIASGTAVTWYRPTAQFILPAMAAGAMQVPGYTQGPALDLLEVY